jgi:hypothetical protein
MVVSWGWLPVVREVDGVVDEEAFDGGWEGRDERGGHVAVEEVELLETGDTGPRERPSGSGSPGTGRAVPSIVTGVSVSSSHRPSPSDIHRIRRNITVVAPPSDGVFFELVRFAFASALDCAQMVVGQEQEILGCELWNGFISIVRKKEMDSFLQQLYKNVLGWDLIGISNVLTMWFS